MPPRPIVLKFGGESLGHPDRVIHRIRTVGARGTPVVVVVSARAGVTDRLRSVRDWNGGGDRVAELRRALERLHPGLPPAGVAALAQLETLVAAVRRSPVVDPADVDGLLSLGERLAAHWFAAELAAHGLPAKALEADRLGLITENSYGGARIDLRASDHRVRAGIGRVLAAGRIPVVTGFFGRSAEGRVATLGRGGSDYTASALGAILRAQRVELVKAGVAIATADPRFVPGAQQVARLSYEEAEELAQFGARVLHPITIEPVAERSVELTVRSLHHDDLATTVGGVRNGGTRAVTRLGPLRLLSVRVAGGRQRPGLIAEIARRLDEVHVNLAAVVTTEAVLGLLVEPPDAARARRALKPFVDASGAVLGRPFPVSLVSVIGEGILDELDRLPPAVLHRSEGLLATARSVSIVVPEPKAIAAVRALHRAFVERRPRPRR